MKLNHSQMPGHMIKVVNQSVALPMLLLNLLFFSVCEEGTTSTMGYLGITN